MAVNDTDSLDVDTISSYIEALKKIFVIKDMEAWNPNLRSKAAIRAADTRYFVDPSIATAALGVGPADLVKDLNTMGLFFETMAVQSSPLCECVAECSEAPPIPHFDCIGMYPQ